MSSIRLPIKIDKQTLYPGNGRRKLSYKASIGALSASADTEVQARAELDRLVHRATETENATVIMYSLCDQSEVWVASGDAHGWHYSIVRPREPGSHYSRASQVGGGWTREECLDRMRDHWYQNNVQPIVEGIVALFTDVRQWVCSRCASVQTGPAPYVCRNPVCGERVQ